MKADDIDATLARHSRHVIDDGQDQDDFCRECSESWPCDAVTALHALRDALARLDACQDDDAEATGWADDEKERADAAEAKVRAVLALCDDEEAAQGSPDALLNTSTVRAAIEGATP